MITDLFVTMKRDVSPARHSLQHRSLYSLFDNTDRSLYRLTVCIDGGGSWMLVPSEADYVIQSADNEGLAPTINRAIANICSVNDYYSHPTHGDLSRVTPLITMVQDDVEYTPGWLEALSSKLLALEGPLKLGFATGHEAPEHQNDRRELPFGYTCPDIRATMMMGRREYWKSLCPIPRFDVETGRVRAKPNDGMGSSVDWHLIRDHELSVRRTGRTCLVMPGLVRHIGHSDSTWLDRPLPETAA